MRDPVGSIQTQTKLASAAEVAIPAAVAVAALAIFAGLSQSFASPGSATLFIIARAFFIDPALLIDARTVFIDPHAARSDLNRLGTGSDG
jgi:hypothetical protein